MVDVDRAAAIEMVRRSGQQGVPVTIIGDNVVVGFDRVRLERILASMQSASPTSAERGASSGSSGRRSLGAKVADAGRYVLPGGTAVAGAYVGSVNPGSPAEAAGLKIGDVIVSVGGTPIASVEDLTAALGKLGSGSVEIGLARGTGRRDVRVEL